MTFDEEFFVIIRITLTSDFGEMASKRLRLAIVTSNCVCLESVVEVWMEWILNALSLS